MSASTDFLASKGIVVDSPSEVFLTHAGVKGMKWGKRRAGIIGTKRGRDQRREAGAERVASNTKSHMNKRVAGKAVLGIVLTKVGSNIIGNASRNASVSIGAKAVSNIVSLGIAANAASDIRNNRIAQKSQR